MCSVRLLKCHGLKMFETVKTYVKARPYLRWWLTFILIPVLIVAEFLRVMWVEFVTQLPYALWEVWNERPWKKRDGQ
jgi:hypothetical protein